MTCKHYTIIAAKGVGLRNQDSQKPFKSGREGLESRLAFGLRFDTGRLTNLDKLLKQLIEAELRSNTLSLGP